MSNPGILPGTTILPLQIFGHGIVEYRYGNYQFSAGDVGKTLALVYSSAAGFWLPHNSQAMFKWGAILSGYNPHASSNVVITPRSGVSIYISGVSGALSTLNIQPKAQFMLFKEEDANTWIASGTGIY